MMRLPRQLITDDRGAALAEFMLGLVPLIIALALIFEFGRAFWSHQAVIKGVRDATRFLTRVEDPSNPAAQAVAQSLLLTNQQVRAGCSAGRAAAQTRWRSRSPRSPTPMARSAARRRSEW